MFLKLVSDSSFTRDLSVHHINKAYYFECTSILIFHFIFAWYDEMNLNGETWSVRIDITDPN